MENVGPLWRILNDSSANSYCWSGHGKSWGVGCMCLPASPVGLTVWGFRFDYTVLSSPSQVKVVVTPLSLDILCPHRGDLFYLACSLSSVSPSVTDTRWWLASGAPVSLSPSGCLNCLLIKLSGCQWLQCCVLKPATVSLTLLYCRFCKKAIFQNFGNIMFFRRVAFFFSGELFSAVSQPISTKFGTNMRSYTRFILRRAFCEKFKNQVTTAKKSHIFSQPPSRFRLLWRNG
jgi:hypothetical protein